MMVGQQDSIPMPPTTRQDTLNPDARSIDSTNLPRLDTVVRQVRPAKPRKKDSVLLGIDSTNIYFFRANIDSLKLQKLNTIDTSTLYFHEFDPLWKYNGLYSTLSNIGLAHTDLVFTPEYSIGYYFAHQSFQKYYYHNDQVRYYKQYIPYTELEYILGSKKEQNFSVIFSRELLKRLTIGFNFALNFARRELLHHVS